MHQSKFGPAGANSCVHLSTAKHVILHRHLQCCICWEIALSLILGQPVWLNVGLSARIWSKRLFMMLHMWHRLHKYSLLKIETRSCEMFRLCEVQTLFPELSISDPWPCERELVQLAEAYRISHVARQTACPISCITDMYCKPNSGHHCFILYLIVCHVFFFQMQEV